MELKNTSKPRRQRLALDITLRSHAEPSTSNPQDSTKATKHTTGSRARNGAKAHSKTISIGLGTRAKNEKKSRSRKSVVLRRVLIVVTVVAAIGLMSPFILQSQAGSEEKPQQSNSSNRPVGNPEYQTVLPAGKSIDELGDWKRVSPPGGDPVFAYIDQIDNVSISVSQQPMPKALKGSPEEQIAELAKKFNATTRINADGTKVYIGTSAKGPQSAILTKNNLLILIKSQEKINDTSWAKYAKSLN